MDKLNMPVNAHPNPVTRGIIRWPLVIWKWVKRPTKTIHATVSVHQYDPVELRRGSSSPVVGAPCRPSHLAQMSKRRQTRRVGEISGEHSRVVSGVLAALLETTP